MTRLDWKFTASGNMYTAPLTYRIERLRNGKWRLRCFASGMESLHPTRLAAVQKAARLEAQS